MGIVRLVVVAVTLSLTAACTPTAAPPTTTPTATPAASPGVLPTPTAMPSPTATPTLSPAPTSTATAAAATARPPSPTPEVDQATWQGPVAISTGEYDMISLAVDSGGHGHVAAELDGSIRYLSNADGSWARQRVTERGVNRRGAVSVHHFPNVGVDQDGHPWIGFVHYEDYSRDCLGCWSEQGYYIVRGAAGWSAPSALPENATGFVQVRDGRAHLAHSEVDYGDVRECGEPASDWERWPIWYATDASGEWTALSVADTGGRPIIRVAPDGGIQIAIGRDGCDRPEHIRLARVDPGRATLISEDVPHSAGRWLVDFFVDPAGLPHLLLGDDTGTGELFYIGRDAAGWKRMELVRDHADSAAITADSRGRIHIATVGRDGIWHLVSDGDEFEPTSLFPRGRDVRIAVDGHDRPHVLINEGGALWYAVGPDR